MGSWMHIAVHGRSSRDDRSGVAGEACAAFVEDSTPSLAAPAPVARTVVVTLADFALPERVGFLGCAADRLNRLTKNSGSLAMTPPVDTDSVSSGHLTTLE